MGAVNSKFARRPFAKKKKKEQKKNTPSFAGPSVNKLIATTSALVFLPTRKQPTIKTLNGAALLPPRIPATRCNFRTLAACWPAHYSFRISVKGKVWFFFAFLVPLPHFFSYFLFFSFFKEMPRKVILPSVSPLGKRGYRLNHRHTDTDNSVRWTVANNIKVKHVVPLLKPTAHLRPTR